jgi:hypothetical protein
MADGNLSPEEIKKAIEEATADVATSGSTSPPQAKGSSKHQLHDWDAPDWSILDDRRGELPEFPLDYLSSPVRAWVVVRLAGPVSRWRTLRCQPLGLLQA